MTNRLYPFGALAAIIVSVLTALTVAGAIDDGGNDARDGSESDGQTVAGVCAPGFEDCEDMVVVGTDDTGNGDGQVLEPVDGDLPATCPTGTPDCNDTPGDADPDLPVSSPDEGEALAIEAAYAALEEMGGPPASAVEVSGLRAVDWNDSCLGVHEEGVVCAQVITPGYVVFLSGAGGDYEFHTDTQGHAVFAPQQ